MPVRFADFEFLISSFNFRNFVPFSWNGMLARFPFFAQAAHGLAQPLLQTLIPSAEVPVFLSS